MAATSRVALRNGGPFLAPPRPASPRLASLPSYPILRRCIELNPVRTGQQVPLVSVFRILFIEWLLLAVTS